MGRFISLEMFFAPLFCAITWFLAGGTSAQSSPTINRVTGESGKLHSPGFPGNYGNNVNVTWEITTRPGFKILLHFTHFDIEDSYEEDQGSCVYDYVEVIYGGKANHRFCGNSGIKQWNAPILNKDIESTSNKLILRFVSDYSNENGGYGGYEAFYNTTDRDECREKQIEVMLAYDDWDEIIYCNHHCHNVPGSYFCSCDPGFHLHTNNHTCTSTCQNVVLEEDYGTITTSNYPKSYSKLANCQWIIKGKKGITIDIRFVEIFSVERHYEEGCVYDWIQYEDFGGRKSDRLCGNKMPNGGEWIKTHSKEVRIVFISDLTEEHAGFKLKYKFNRVYCGEAPPPREHGFIRSPSLKFVFEDVAEYGCVEGYRVIGGKDITCMSNGKWSGMPPKCEAIVCSHPSDIINSVGVAPVLLPASVGYGTVINVSCTGQYFEMTSGAGSWICGEDALWVPYSPPIAPNANNNLPECTAACGLKGNARRLSLRRKRSVLGPETNVGELALAVRPFPGNTLVAAVVRGKPAKYGEWPWMAFIDLFGFGLRSAEFCGGALVSTRTVITAAHCTVRTYRDKIKVFLGTSERYNSQDEYIQKFGVFEMHEHPNFTLSKFDSDIAILILDRPVVIGKYVRPVCLPRSAHEIALPKFALTNQENYQKTGIIAGWGVTETGYLPLELNMARVPPIDQKECAKLFETNKPEAYSSIMITDNMICAGYPGKGKGRDSCQGDSGGPLMFKDPVRSKYFLTGIVSFGSSDKCGDGTFGIYTRVSQFISWIDNFTTD